MTNLLWHGRFLYIYAKCLLSCIQFSILYIGGLIVILVGLVLYNMKLVPKGDTDQSVFSVGYWCNYGHSLFCEWRCCPAQDKELELNDDGDDHPLVNDNVDYKAITNDGGNDQPLINDNVDCQAININYP